MKKTIAGILAVCMLLSLCVIFAGAKDDDTIRLRLNSDVAGCTTNDVDKMIEILSGPVEFYHDNSSPVDIANYAGGSEYAHMEAGRSYTVTYALIAKDGYTLPETLSDGDVVFECGKGVKVIYCKVIEMANTNLHPAPGEARTTRLLRVMANVVADGNALQRLIGWIRDIILKIRSFQID